MDDSVNSENYLVPELTAELARFGGNQAELSRRIGIPTPTLNRILKHGKRLSHDNYVILDKYFKKANPKTTKNGGDYTEILKRYITFLEKENARLNAEILRITTGENDRRKRSEA